MYGLAYHRQMQRLTYGPSTAPAALHLVCVYIPLTSVLCTTLETLRNGNMSDEAANHRCFRGRVNALTATITAAAEVTLNDAPSGTRTAHAVTLAEIGPLPGITRADRTRGEPMTGLLMIVSLSIFISVAHALQL